MLRVPLACVMVKPIYAVVLLAVSSFIAAKSNVVRQFGISDASVYGLISSIREEDLTDKLVIPSKLSWRENARIYQFVARLSYSRDLKSPNINGGYNLILLTMKFVDSKRVECSFSEYLYVGNKLDIDPILIVESGIEIKKLSCSSYIKNVLQKSKQGSEHE